jgi:sugar lactone lactonase YvrE
VRLRGRHETAFSLVGKAKYLNESLSRVTLAFDLTGDDAISNCYDWLPYGEDDGFSDGMAVDVEGGI